MKAAVCRQFGKPLAIEDIALAAPGPHDIRVKVRACAICHSDITYAEGGWGGALPAVYGHEAAGIVLEAGALVKNVKPGDHVVVTLIRSCGACHYCARGSQVMCEEVFDLDKTSPVTDASGAPVTHGMRTGAFAEEVVVHASQAVAVGKELPFEVASLLACGVITGYGAVVHTANLKPGEHAVVVGCGGVGLNAIQGAALWGAASITAVDLEDTKLEAARRFGATHTVNPKKGDAREAIMAVTDRRGADYVFVTVGAKPALDDAFDFIKKEGTVIVVGMPPSGIYAQYDPGVLAAWNQTVKGSKMGSSRIAEDIPALVRLYKEGRLKLDELISGRYPLEGINEAMASVKRGEALRNVIVFE
jgi:S-(hydroxymethyl)glutathione dehydrogenase / alcohol dehydrogenase